MSDVKRQRDEQERKGKISNPDIGLRNLNFDFVDDKRDFINGVKSRVDDLKESGSRVQKNSCSHVFKRDYSTAERI